MCERRLTWSVDNFVSSTTDEKYTVHRLRRKCEIGQLIFQDLEALFTANKDFFSTEDLIEISQEIGPLFCRISKVEEQLSEDLSFCYFGKNLQGSKVSSSTDSSCFMTGTAEDVTATLYTCGKYLKLVKRHSFAWERITERLTEQGMILISREVYPCVDTAKLLLDKLVEKITAED